MLKITEYSSWGEFLRESDEIERRLTLGAIRQFHEERSPE